MVADLAIGIDVGATKTAAALVSGSAEELAVYHESTPQASAGDIVELLGGLIDRLLVLPELSGRRVPIGIGLPAQIEFAKQRVLRATNLPLGDTDVAHILRERLGAPIVIDNDGNLAALAETRFGAAAGCSDVVCLTMGTGIGGGLILNGELYRGWLGTGAEVGHMLMDPNGRECNCGAKGCFETLAAGPALERNARRAIADHPDSLLAELSGGDPKRLTGLLITEAARQGDPVAVGLFEHIGGILGQALTSLANLLNPEVFVIGGGMMEAGDLLLEPARRFVAECATEPVRIGLRIVPAKFGNKSGYLGAAALAREYFSEERED